MVACKPAPQKVRHLGEEEPVDSALIKQLEFNKYMVMAADEQCIQYVKSTNLPFTQDDFGFWYYKSIKTQADTLKKGQQVCLHIQVYELNDTLLADVKEVFSIGSGRLPSALNHTLLITCMGEEVQVVAPWYTAYGVEGTSLIRPYSNVRIVMKVDETTL